jgi:hypothetical protein
MQGLITAPYADFAQRVFAAFAEDPAVAGPSDVAEAVWRAANDGSDRRHHPAGADALALSR